MNFNLTLKNVLEFIVVFKYTNKRVICQNVYHLVSKLRSVIVNHIQIKKNKKKYLSQSWNVNPLWPSQREEFLECLHICILVDNIY